MNTRELFEAELASRGLSFTIDKESGRHEVQVGGAKVLVSLDNLERDVARDHDAGRVSRFVDAVVSTADFSDHNVSADQIYWCLEPNDHVEKADFRAAVSDRVDRVLVHLTPDGTVISWLTPKTLDSLGLSEAEAGAKAFENLGRALREATLEWQDIDSVRLGYVNTTLPFKSSLILAPNLREIVEPVVGWPLLAAAPDRDFLYFWPAEHREFASRVGKVVVEEYSCASYPISTEVYEIDDGKFRAIGEFPAPK